ncbi:hypothetical protein ESV85_18570 [Algoriphagus aquimarinus]|uniref:Uncharacterized protein n=2 Tax=Algoriphagus aquimarinus TaxID=237018 RepID=A0A5C7ABU5_9BACT|nr:hypothetical protein ESV85_18570 [Algoriphagus aquimarinus]
MRHYYTDQGVMLHDDGDHLLQQVISSITIYSYSLFAGSADSPSVVGQFGQGGNGMSCLETRI